MFSLSRGNTGAAVAREINTVPRHSTMSGQVREQSYSSSSGSRSDSSQEDSDVDESPSFNWCRFCFFRKSNQLRYLVLFVSCFLSFGMAFTMDFPGSLGCGSDYSIEAYFRSAGKEYNQRMNQALYSVYSWPNTVLAIFGGILIDKYIGLRRALVLFTLFLFFGAYLFSYGIQQRSYPLMVLGRVMYGLGGESLGVAQSTFISRWFTKESGMSFAFGICLCVSRTCASFNFLFAPILATKFGVVATVYIGSVLCGASVLGAFLLYALDKYAVRKGVIEGERGDEVMFLDENGTQADVSPSSPTFKVSDIRRFSLSFWYLCGICLFSYNAVAPFVGFAKIFFQVKYNYDGARASQYISSCQLTSAILSPIVGYLVDRMGRNTYILIFVSGALAFIHVLFIATSISPLALMMMIGLLISFLAASLWPAVPLVVPPKAVASSFGVMTSLQNIGLAIFPMIVGAILDSFTENPQENSSPDDNSTSFGTPFENIFSFPFKISEETNGEEEAVTLLPALKGFQIALFLLVGAALMSLALSFALLYRDLHHGNHMLSISGAARQANLDFIFDMDDENEDIDEEESEEETLLGNADGVIAPEGRQEQS